MRLWPTRIVLAALAFIVGAVLALPMLLARKADARDATPRLETDAGGSCLQAAQLADEALAVRSADNCGGFAGPVVGVAVGPLTTADAGVALPETLALDDGGLLPEIGRLTIAFTYAETPRPWPPAQTIDRQRKYHLRP